MVHRQRGKTLLDSGDRLQRHNAAIAAGEANIIQRRQPRRRLGVVLQYHAILVGLGINCRDQPLAKGVIQRVIDIRHGNT